MGGLALLLRDLTPAQAATGAIAAVLFNLLLLPRVAPGLFRVDERREPWRSGIILYPAAVLLLVVLFRARMEVAAAAWVIMASGDAAAGWIGVRFGRRRLPWNRGKSWAGSAAFAIAAARRRRDPRLDGAGRGRGGGAGAATALFAAGIESCPGGCTTT
jgi:dolichol kinase